MAHTLANPTAAGPELARSSVTAATPAYQAYLILYAGYLALPIVAGVDKFFNLLCDWSRYLAPLATQVVPVESRAFLYGVGVIEIAAGILVALYPRVGAYVVTLWLWGIIVNLLLAGGFYDIALRDFGLSLGAIALGRLSQEFADWRRPGP
jgi:hypothetical protein